MSNKQAPTGESDYYVIGDLHLHDEDVLEVYRQNDFDCVSEMDDSLIDNWRSKVSNQDRIIFLGDLAVGSKKSDEVVWDAFTQLPPESRDNWIFTNGNHDIARSEIDEIDLPISHYELGRFKDYTFCFIHKPQGTDEVEEDYDWLIHGHIHNDKLDEYPLIDQDDQKVNVSAELLNYYPIELSKIVRLIESGTSYETIDEAPVEHP